MKYKSLRPLLAVICLGAVAVSCGTMADGNSVRVPQTQGNPYLPLWEHIPDGEPYVFEDPDHPGEYRVYIYGSHDNIITGYCGRDQVVWSAPVDSLGHWRYDGTILCVTNDANGNPLHEEGKGDVLFAPDVALSIDSTGQKTYYLYPNDQEGGRNGLVARSSRPDGPFEVSNWSTSNPAATDGVLAFDPAVFVDDDGRVYGYWGFERSFAAELDPATMATVLPGTQIVQDMVSGRNQPGQFRFFEASSIRKIEDKYVFIYSRFTEDGEFNLPTSNYTLAYAYSDHPLGPYTYGGTIIDGRGRETDEQGRTIASATPDGNTHGSICKIGNQWYVFYHRQTGTDEYSRQAMVAPISVEVQKGVGGKVVISEGEYNSCGFSLDGLDPFEPHSAGIACWYTGPEPAVHEWPNNTFSGSYVASPGNTPSEGEQLPHDSIGRLAPYDLRYNRNLVVNNTDGSIVGFKYFLFPESRTKEQLKLRLKLIPAGIDGTIEVMADRPWTSQGGRLIATLPLHADSPQESTEVTAKIADASLLAGKHAIYLKFSSDVKGTSLCTLEELVFE